MPIALSTEKGHIILPNDLSEVVAYIASGQNRSLTFICALAVLCLIVALTAEWPEHIPHPSSSIVPDTTNRQSRDPVLSSVNENSNLRPPPVVHHTHLSPSSQARTESFNFFDNIRDADWQLMKTHIKTDYDHQYNVPSYEQHIPAQWYAANFDPNFSCLHERKVNISGASENEKKWVCDPHRIGRQVHERKSRGKNGCLVYSVSYSLGATRNKNFENEIDRAIGEPCEIHIFDPRLSGNKDTVVPEGHNVHFHNWGFVNSDATAIQRQGNYKTFQETLDMLHHNKHFIDVLSVDCAGCEWKVYNDWFNSDVKINQILVEVHSAPKEAIPFFKTFHDEGYVTFHKENSPSQNGCCFEYSFLRLSKTFFEK